MEEKVASQNLKKIAVEIVVFLIFCVLAVLHRSRELSTIATKFIGGDRLDGGIYVFHAREIISSFSWNNWFHVNMFYPFGYPLAYTDNYILPAIIIKIILFATDNFTLAYNLVFLFAWALNGYCVYLLGRYLKWSLPLCLLAGFSFQLYPFFVAHAGHPQLQFAFFIPLSLCAGLRFLEVPSYRAATLMGVSIVASFLCSAYYSLFIVLLLTLTFVGGFIAFRISLTREFLSKLLLPAFFCGVVFLPFIYPYLEVKNLFGDRQALALKSFSSSLLAYLTTPLGNTFLGPETHHWSHFEARAFPGVMLSVLFLLALIFLTIRNFRKCSRFDIALYAAIAGSLVVSLVFEIYSKYSGDRTMLFWTRAILLWVPVVASFALLFRREKFIVQQLKLLLFLMLFFIVASLGILSITDKRFTLFGLLYDYFPGFSAIRASGRLAVVSQLLLTVIVFTLLEQILRLKIRQTVLWFLVIVLGIFNFWETRYYFIFEKHSDAAAPAIYEQIAGLQGVVVALPMQTKSGAETDLVLNQTQYMNWFSGSSLKLFNGYSGNIARFHSRMVEKLKNFPQQQALTHLSEIAGLNYVVFHGSKIPNFIREDFEQQLSQVSDQLQIVFREGDDFLLSFVPKLTKVESSFVFPSKRSKQELTLTLESEVKMAVPMTISVSLISNKGAKAVPLSDHQIVPDATPQQITLQVPAASQKVYPQILLLKVPQINEVRGVYLRHVDLN